MRHKGIPFDSGIVFLFTFGVGGEGDGEGVATMVRRRGRFTVYLQEVPRRRTEDQQRHDERQELDDPHG